MEKVLTDSQKLNNDFMNNRGAIESFNKKMQEKYKDLFTEYKSIYRISMTDKYDHARLRFMLEMSEKIKNKEITEHDASVQVGEVLVNEIVKPQLEKKN